MPDLPAFASSSVSRPRAPGEPPTPQEVWLPISSTYNFVCEDPLLDWLELYGERAGYARDNDPAAGLYNPDLDFAHFLSRQGERFEAGVYKLLRERFRICQVGHRASDAYDPDFAEETMAAMRCGVPLIAQAVLRDPAHRTYGIADLLVRSDQLAGLLSEQGDFSPSAGLSPPERIAPAPALGEAARSGGWHYVVLDIKFSILELLRDGHAGKSHLPGAVQVWLYNEALGAMQGFTPSCGYLLGRNWSAGSGPSEVRGAGCLERLARVDRDHLFKARGADHAADQTLADIARAALDWGRRVNSAEAAAWHLEPTPSVPELYPNMKNGDEDFPWHGAKKKLAAVLRELTLLPSITPAGRTAALARGVRRWDTPGLTATSLGIITPAHGRLLDATLAANRLVLPAGAPAAGAVLPPAIPDGICAGWKTEAPFEFFVDFETVSSLADDFSALPAMGGQTLIFQIGCGRYEEGRWAFRQWTVARLNETEELRIINEWVAHMERALAKLGHSLSAPDAAKECRIIHWSPAEPSFLENSRESARSRQARRNPEAALWPHLPFFDLLNLVVKAAPVTVRGAFGFGLKSMAHALHDAGLIEAVWSDGPADGLGAMVGAWSCEEVAARTGVPIPEQPLMASIGAYNEIDCQTMGEMLALLRRR